MIILFVNICSLNEYISLTVTEQVYHFLEVEYVQFLEAA